MLCRPAPVYSMLACSCLQIEGEVPNCLLCSAGYSFQAPCMPKQCNSYDCGMHVLGERTILQL